MSDQLSIISAVYSEDVDVAKILDVGLHHLEVLFFSPSLPMSESLDVDEPEEDEEPPPEDQEETSDESQNAPDQFVWATSGPSMQKPKKKKGFAPQLFSANIEIVSLEDNSPGLLEALPYSQEMDAGISVFAVDLKVSLPNQAVGLRLPHNSESFITKLFALSNSESLGLLTPDDIFEICYDPTTQTPCTWFSPRDSKSDNVIPSQHWGYDQLIHVPSCSNPLLVNVLEVVTPCPHADNMAMCSSYGEEVPVQLRRYVADDESHAVVSMVRDGVGVGATVVTVEMLGQETLTKEYSGTGSEQVSEAVAFIESTAPSLHEAVAVNDKAPADSLVDHVLATIE